MTFGGADYVLLAVAALTLAVPGGLVLGAAGWLRRGRRAALLGAAPVVTIGLLYLTATLSALVGVRYGWSVVLIATAAAVVVVLVVRLRLAHRLAGGRALIPALRWPTRMDVRRSAEPVVGFVLVLVAAVLAVQTWSEVLGGSLATVPQEHDMITHTLLTAYIEDTGRAAPWRAFPVDVLSGLPGTYYPSGFHSVAALVGAWSGDPVAAVNATMLVVFALFLPLGLYGLAAQLRPGTLPHVAGGAAAVVGVMAYRPTYAIMHDGGVLANAMAISLSAGAIAGLLVLRGRRVVTGRWGAALDVAAVAMLAVGAFAVHPTSAAIVGVSVIAWSLGDLVHRARRAEMTRWLLTIVAGGAVGGLLLFPLLRSAGKISTVTSWPRDFEVVTFSRGMGIVLGMPYLGFFDQSDSKSQAALAGLTLLGVGIALWSRRYLGALLTWVVWSAILLAFLSGSSIPGLTSVTEVFYNSYLRISGVLGPFQWVLAGIAVSSVSLAVTRVCAAVLRLLPTGPLLLRVSRPLGAATAALLVLLLVFATHDLRVVNAQALVDRYAQPLFTRVDGNDRAAFAWLRGHVQPGERVMNNANDGSTYMYVYDQIPMVNGSPLGNSRFSYTEELLTNFNKLETDLQMQGLVRNMNIRWVYIDTNSPQIGVAQGLYPWYKGGSTYSIAPGMENLGSVPGLNLRFTNGSVSVYEVAPRFLSSSP
jgi:hypothetical protein